MGLRFRRSIKLAPGLKMNISGSGLSWSIGGRGASVTFGKRGTYVNTGIPGTGLYSRQRIDSHSIPSRSTPQNRTSLSMKVSVAIHDDGTVFFKDMNGNIIEDSLAAKIKKQNNDAIKNLIQNKCNEINGQVEDLAKIHRHTPSPDEKPSFTLMEFPKPQPTPPTPKKIGFFASLFKSNRERIEAENAAQAKHYHEEFNNWQQEKVTYEQDQAIRKKLNFRSW